MVGVAMVGTGINDELFKKEETERKGKGKIQVKVYTVLVKLYYLCFKK